ncbi:ABC transporter substrate-binding protein [Paenibacillus sedimenti]|uniref:Extracellular solute-binding protein n=1 Tax=Paenibacillus sedimenti TaxID=2770274 RepID=A0A926KRK2_9BACL|nr:extracellular solute-binding protein [Paenibacillus sedimenti]MBD0380909.1 extracellular solute-binding protein [Paenibacillus sedimenti]
MKKFSTIVLAAAMTTTLLAGCGKSSTGNEPASTKDASSAATSATSATAAAKKPVTLKYMTWNYADATKSTDAYIKDMKDKFNITIELQNIPTDQYESAVKAKLAAKDLPDLMYVHSISKDLFMEKVQIDANQFADLSDLKSVSEYLPALIKERKDNKAGKLFYVPNSTNALGVIYNKKVFSDHGIAVPTNINEFTAAAEKLKAANIIPISGGFKDSWTTQIINFIAFGQYINAKDMSTRVKLADLSLKYADIKTDITKVLNVQLDWIDKGYFPKDFLGTDINVASAMVGTGKAAMLINGTWQYKAVQDADPKAQIGFFTLPLNAPGEKTVVPTTANEGIVVNADSKNLEAAKIAMDYYLSAENQTRVLNEKNGIPTNTKVKVDNAFSSDVNAAFAAGEVQPDFWGVAGLYKPTASTFAIDKEMQNLIAKGITIDQFIANFDKANAPK